VRSLQCVGVLERIAGQQLEVGDGEVAVLR
jgi:hypothetical protein